MLCVFCIKRQNYKKERKYQHIALLYCSILLPDNFLLFCCFLSHPPIPDFLPVSLHSLYI